MNDHTFKIGAIFSKDWQFDIASVHEFALLAGDSNPIHHDSEYAKTTRFQQPIVSGTQYVAMMMGVVASYAKERQPNLGLEFSFQLKKAVLANEKIRIVWEITDTVYNEKLQGNLVYFTGKLLNEKNEVCTVAYATILTVDKM